MTADDTPRPTVLACPDTRIAERSSNHSPSRLDRETRAQRDDGDIGADSTNAQLLRFVCAKTNRTCRMRVEVLSLRSDATIGASEQELVGNESIEGNDIRVQLRVANLCFALEDLRVARSEERRFHHRDVQLRHGFVPPGRLRIRSLDLSHLHMIPLSRQAE